MRPPEAPQQQQQQMTFQSEMQSTVEDSLHSAQQRVPKSRMTEDDQPNRSMVEMGGSHQPQSTSPAVTMGIAQEPTGPDRSHEGQLQGNQTQSRQHTRTQRTGKTSHVVRRKRRKLSGPQDESASVENNSRSRHQASIPGPLDKVICLDSDADEAEPLIEVRVDATQKRETDGEHHVTPEMPQPHRRSSTRRRSAQDPIPPELTTKTLPAISQSSDFHPITAAGDIMSRAVADLLSQNNRLEKELKDTKGMLESQGKHLDRAEAKAEELTVILETKGRELGDVRNRMGTVTRFVKGLGGDYDNLNKRNIALRTMLDEVLKDKQELQTDLEAVRQAQRQYNAESGLRRFVEEAEAVREEIQRMHSYAENQEAIIMEKIGLLAEERDRTVSLESQLKQEREENRKIISRFSKDKEEMITEMGRIRKFLQVKFETLSEGEEEKNNRFVGVVIVL